MFDYISIVISLFSLVMAILAYLMSKLQLKSSQYESRNATASAIYQQYLSLCLSHPDLAWGNIAKIKNKPDIYSKYKWFISNMLYSFELILKVSGNDTQWQTAIEAQLMRHCWHLTTSGSIKRKEWEEPLQTLIERVIVKEHCLKITRAKL